jgi:hypothetical protein
MNRMATTTPMTRQTCRFCYSYKPQGFIQPVCKPIAKSDDETISLMGCTTSIVNNNIQASQRSLLLSQQQTFLNGVQSTIMMSTVQSTINNAAVMNSTIYSQLVQVQAQRYAPYQPYIPPVMPSSVIQLQMIQANAGNPVPPFSIMNCKGVQFVTK